MAYYEKDWERRSRPPGQRDEWNEESGRRNRAPDFDDEEERRAEGRRWEWTGPREGGGMSNRNDRPYMSSSTDHYGAGRYGPGKYGAGRSAGQTERGWYGHTGYDERERGFGRSGFSGDERGDSRYFTGSQGSWAVTSPDRRPASRYGADYRDHGYAGEHNERGFFERAGDEIASWFGDEDAARRREQDHRGHGPADYTRSDERIREDVNDRLTEDRRLDARRITVAVSDGEVTLNGTVSDRADKRRAEDSVEDISGVRHVQNNLRIDNAARSFTSSQSRTTTPSTTSGHQPMNEAAMSGEKSASGSTAGSRPTPG